MFQARVVVKDETARVRRAVKASEIRNLGQAGAYLRGIAQRSIKISKDPAPPGHQPHSRKGRLKKSIFFAVEKAQQDVVIGSTVSGVGRIGHTHEFGGTEPPKGSKGRSANFRLEVGGHGPIAVEGGRPVVVALKNDRQVARARAVAGSLPPSMARPASGKARKYPPRPFMGPALKIGRARLPQIWANSVRG